MGRAMGVGCAGGQVDREWREVAGVFIVLAKGGSETSPNFRAARGFCGSGVGLNPIGVAAGVKSVGDEPMLVEFTKLERVGAGIKKSPCANRAGGREKRVP